MRNWKELGEVPDSDEESLDNPEPEHDVHCDRTPESGQLELPSRPDVSVDGENNHLSTSKGSALDYTSLENADNVLVSSPLSSPPSDLGSVDLSAPDSALSDSRPVLAVEPLVSPRHPTSSQLQKDSPAQLFEQDEISTPYVKVTAPTSETRVAAETVQSSSRLLHRPGELGLGRHLEDNGDAVFADAVARAERSLRPRKPIQQHPYLLESVRYATFMRKHGVRPVRVVTSQGLSRRLPEEDSQDEDFQADSSQGLPTNGIPESGEDGGPMVFDGIDDEHDVLAPSSSPPEKNPTRNLQTSSQRTAEGETDDTSLVDEDFPSLDELARGLTKTPGRASTTSAKRNSSINALSNRTKRVRVEPGPQHQPSPTPRGDIWTLTSSSPEPVARPHRWRRPSLVLPTLRHDSDPVAPEHHDTGPSHPLQYPSETIDLTKAQQSSDSRESESETNLDENESGSESEVVRRHAKRIRGVLPASWLRLDQMKSTTPSKKRRQSRNHPPEQGVRRGVAVARPATPKHNPSTPFLFDSDDDAGFDPTTATPARQQDSPMAGQLSALDILLDDDCASSAMEEDIIDAMLPGLKRKQPSSHRSQSIKKRTARHREQHHQRTSQPRITEAFHSAQPLHHGRRGEIGTEGPSQRYIHKTHHKRKVQKVHQLSILDVVEPTDAQFVKIAARTARRRKDLGKSSPSRKRIDLGTRHDNLDARSVLHAWKSGRIRPRVSDSGKLREDARRRRALGEVSTNLVTSDYSRVGSDYFESDTCAASVVSPKDIGANKYDQQKTNFLRREPSGSARLGDASLRPAQLEIIETECPERTGFVAKKRTLDALYRKSRKQLVPEAVGSNEILAAAPSPEFHTARQPEQSEQESTPAQYQTRHRSNTKSRFRKQTSPKFVDISAPYIAHANDPLCENPVVLPKVVVNHTPDKLVGLGPYGTHYEYHFNIFPLDHGVFFHETTLIGQGYISKVGGAAYRDKTRQSRPSRSFIMDGRTLRWGPWDDTVSSELGIVVDWVGDQIFYPTAGVDGVPTRNRAIEGARFIVTYIIDSLNLVDDESEKSFLRRIREVFQGFLSRIQEINPVSQTSQTSRKIQADVLAHFLVGILAALQLGRAGGSAPTISPIEDTLTAMAKQCIQSLLSSGFDDVRALYGELQQLSGRERGIRRDHMVVHAWVIVIRVLENANIPRAGFWDICQPVMMKPEILAGTDAQGFETLWRNMFTLLPLCEFDDSGVLAVGSRHTAPIEGWALPQQILRRVFQLYMSNPRQGPNFNEYCRALAARCHYLVQQWGWRKCMGVIGTIFDFFGSQNLGHLRNEEVYKSPQFLEDLARNPSLTVMPEDRCFHVFLKTLGLAITRMKKFGLYKDIKNLIARTLPNHNREYLKENTIHQKELDALRNHHDLLCTLFWAAPPDLRPAIHLIEKLVVPSRSHREACIINVRTWSQLARFVVSSGEADTAFKPFMAWQTRTFQQLLDQYLGAASDIHQQLLGLSNDSRQISNSVVNSTIRRNRAVALDILYLTVKASFEVLRLASSLSTATTVLNTYQLQQLLTRLDFSSEGFDWSILLLALDMLDYYVSRVEQAAQAQYSSDSTGMTDPQAVEEAVLLLDHKLAEPFFFMCRTLLDLPRSDMEEGGSGQSLCTEKAVILSGRLACRFIDSGITRTVSYFTSRKYGLFRGLPVDLPSSQATHLSLFLATLVKHNIFDFKDIGPSLLGLWLMSIVKPRPYLLYENYLAGTLKQQNIAYVQRTVASLESVPDYSTNRAFFAAGLSFMRETLRPGGAVQRKQLGDEYSACLKLVMRKMKDDLRALKTDAAEHRQYMLFVREVVTLLKSHGVGICVVDPFFTQPSSDYSPPMEDPQLHTAGIIAYGVRLGEGESVAAPQLFHYLYNNFKIALSNDKLHEQCTILAKAMGHAHVLSFIVGKVVPAIIWATSKENNAWPLLDVYVSALSRILTRSTVPKEIGKNDIRSIAALVRNVLSWFRTLLGSNQSATSLTQLHIIVRLVEMVLLFEPSLASYLLSWPFAEDDGIVANLGDAVNSFAGFLKTATSYLEEVCHGSVHLASISLGQLPVRPLLAGAGEQDSDLVFQSGRELDPQVDGFANLIAGDVARNWDVSAVSISWRTTAGRGPAVATATQHGAAGSTYEFETGLHLVVTLRSLLRRWRLGRASEVMAISDRSRYHRLSESNRESLIF